MRTELVALAAIVTASLVSMAVYALAGRRRSPSRHTETRGSFALGAWVREWFYWALHPVERAIEAAALAPEVFNALGVLVALGSMAAYGAGALPLGGVLLLASGVADVLDGVAARAQGVVSRRGAFLDSTLDRFAESAVFVGLIAFYDGTAARIVVVAALAGSLLVSYTRARGEGLGVQCKVGVMQRAERMLILGIASWIDPGVSSALDRPGGSLLLFVLAVVATASLGTAIYRTIWIARELERSETR